jgi:predicted alpha-1,2-mannosidase
MVTGRADLQGGWGHNEPYYVYFAIEFDKPITEMLMAHGSGFSMGPYVIGPDSRAAFSFGKKRTINIKVGISYVSVARARKRITTEAAGDFSEISAKARQIWDRSLERIRVSGGKERDKQIFYSSYYRLLCMPSDLGVDDENPLWNSGVRSFTDFYCLWDSVRNANSLLFLMDPERSVDILNSLLDIADHHEGWLPDAWISHSYAFLQGGSPAAILFAEAYFKGLGGIDYKKALTYSLKNVHEQSPDPLLFGRYVSSENSPGYIPSGTSRNCVSRSLEYAFEDFCIARLAKALDQKKDAETLHQESEKIWSLWREDYRCFGPKDRKGNFVDFDPDTLAKDNYNDPNFYEASSRSWTLHAMHILPELIKRLGGEQSFIDHLDDYFDSGQFRVKETKMHIPLMYSFAGRPDRTADIIREKVLNAYGTGADGLPDNEDMGAQTACFMFYSMGIYPVIGTDLYIISPPSFDKVEMDLGTSGRILEIHTTGLEQGGRYMAGVRLNGVTLDRVWLNHKELTTSSERILLEIQLSKDWTGFGGSNRPPFL